MYARSDDLISSVTQVLQQDMGKINGKNRLEGIHKRRARTYQMVYAKNKDEIPTPLTGPLSKFESRSERKSLRKRRRSCHTKCKLGSQSMSSQNRRKSQKKPINDNTSDKSGGSMEDSRSVISNNSEKSSQRSSKIYRNREGTAYEQIQRDTPSSKWLVTDRARFSQLLFVWKSSNLQGSSVEPCFKVGKPNSGTDEVAAIRPYASCVDHRPFISNQNVMRR